MKKTMMIVAIAALAAGTAFAQRGDGRGPKRDGTGPEDCGMTGPGPKAGKALRGERPGGPMSAEMKDQMRAEHRAIRELGNAARAETDEAKQAELVAQLRVKLGEVADRMQAHQEERLAQAEERLSGLKERVADGKANRDARIEEQIQRILSGERPPVPDAFKQRPYAKGAKGAKNARRGPGDGLGLGPCGDPPPPPPAEDDAPGEVPPPPLE